MLRLQQSISCLSTFEVFAPLCYLCILCHIWPCVSGVHFWCHKRCTTYWVKTLCSLSESKIRLIWRCLVSISHMYILFLRCLQINKEELHHSFPSHANKFNQELLHKWDIWEDSHLDSEMTIFHIIWCRTLPSECLSKISCPCKVQIR